MKFRVFQHSILALVLATGTLRAEGTDNSVPTPMTVEVDQSQLVMLSADPATVVVGNPSLADISLNGKQMFIHGHSFGETNIMVFDIAGNKIVNLYVSVAHHTDNQLTVFMSNTRSPMPSRYTYTCAPNCEPNMMVGDQQEWMPIILGNNQAKYKFATGSLTPDVKNQAQPPN
jgi:Pilus formation protein N terminal region